MAREAGLEPLLEDEPERLAERVHHRDGRGVVVDALPLRPVVRDHPGVEVPALHLGLARLHRVERARRERERREPGRAGEALLRAGVDGVRLPGVHLHRHAAERGDGVDDEQRAVRVAELAEPLHRLVRAGRGLGVDERDHLHLALLLQRLLDPGRLDRLAPGDVELHEPPAGAADDVGHAARRTRPRPRRSRCRRARSGSRAPPPCRPTRCRRPRS